MQISHPPGFMQPGFFGHSRNYAENGNWLTWQSSCASASFIYTLHTEGGPTSFGESTDAGDTAARDEVVAQFYRENGGRGKLFSEPLPERSMSQTADEYKEYSFDEGKLRIEYLPEVQDEEGHRIQLSRVRIKVTDMPPGKYKVGDSWVDECYAEPLMGKRMFYAFSEEDAQYWMHSLYRTYVDSPDDY